MDMVAFDPPSVVRGPDPPIEWLRLPDRRHLGPPLDAHTTFIILLRDEVEPRQRPESRK